MQIIYFRDNTLEYDGSSNMLASYTHSGLALDDVLSASVTTAGVTAGLASSAGHFYYLKDSLGSVTDVVNTSGNLVQKYDYSAFGRILSIKDGNGADISSTPVVKTSFTFTGREWDEESGLYFYRARTYDPQIGRFLQTDPDPGNKANPISEINKYTYVANSSENKSDPSGAIPQDGRSQFGNDDPTSIHGNSCGFSAQGYRLDANGKPYIAEPTDDLDRFCMQHDNAYSADGFRYGSLTWNNSTERVRADLNLGVEGLKYSLKGGGPQNVIAGLLVAVTGFSFFEFYSLPLLGISGIGEILHTIGISW